MLSPAQEARVLDVLGDCPSGTLRTYCLDCLAAAVKIPPAHAADLVAFVQPREPRATARFVTAASATRTDMTRMTFSSGDQTRRFRGYVERILKARVGRGARNANRAVRLAVA